MHETLSKMNAAPLMGDYPIEDIRSDFPILQQRVHGHPLVYLDSAASTQKPKPVIQSMVRFLEQDYANIHRGVHELSMRSTDLHDAAREKVRKFINAGRAEEIIFTRNATESINLIAASWGRTFLKEGDEVLITALEHHANIVPWQFLRDAIGISLKVCPITPEGEVKLDVLRALVTPKTKLISVAHVSNALGTILPIAEIIDLAHKEGALALIDGCQAVSHMEVDLRGLDADFYVFSGHKLYGPSGIGVLYGKFDVLQSMPPYQGGGDMIESVSFETSTFKSAPHRFEAGTPAITEAIGLASAIDYVSAIGLKNIERYESELLGYATDAFRGINSLRIIGTAAKKASILSFVMQDAHPHDIGTILDREGIAIRAGHHCAQPLMDYLGLSGTARASLGLYTTKDEIDRLVDGLKRVREIFS